MSHEPAAGIAMAPRRVRRVAIFGATGMIGQGVLRECLQDADIVSVLCIGRRATGQSHPKLADRTVPDLTQLGGLSADLAKVDACFYCLGVSAVGMSESDYRRITYDLAVGVARALVDINPGMSFVFVSGEGADSTEHKGQMWARVKGATENAVHAMPFKSVFAFRPFFIQPLEGIVPRTARYRAFYTFWAPFYRVLRALAPSYVTDTQRVGLAMLQAVRHGAPHWIVKTRDINALAGLATRAKASSASSRAQANR